MTLFARHLQNPRKLRAFPHVPVFSLPHGPLDLYLHAICKSRENYELFPMYPSSPYRMGRSTFICAPFAKAAKPVLFHCINRLGYAVNRS